MHLLEIIVQQLTQTVTHQTKTGNETTHLVHMANNLWLLNHYSNLPDTALADPLDLHSCILLDMDHMMWHVLSCSNHQSMVVGWWLC